MAVDHVHTESAPETTAGVRLCGRCERPLPAVDKTEYTPERARMVTVAGFCVCLASDGVLAWIPRRAPSLL